MTAEFEPIGTVENAVTEKIDTGWGQQVSRIVLQPEYAGGLRGLGEFSHALVLCWLHEARYQKDKHLCRRPQGRAELAPVGIFAQRTKDRPCPIGVTAVEIVSVEETVLTVRGLDAIDGTPVLDIKPYFPAFDRRDATVPAWVHVLMDPYF